MARRKVREGARERGYTPQASRGEMAGQAPLPGVSPPLRVLGTDAQTPSPGAPQSLPKSPSGACCGFRGSAPLPGSAGRCERGSLQARLPRAPIPKMTNGDPIRRLENGHLCASLHLLLGLEIAELEGEPQGGVPAGPSRDPERCRWLQQEQGTGGLGVRGPAGKGWGRRDTARTLTERRVVVWPELGVGCVWGACGMRALRSNSEASGPPAHLNTPFSPPPPLPKRERESKRKKENKISPVVETRGENRGKHP